jgi:hypothetical protein
MYCNVIERNIKIAKRNLVDIIKDGAKNIFL